MADWPELEEIAQVLDIGDPDNWTVTLTRIRLAAIDRVKKDVGGWVDSPEEDPDDNMAQAALRMAELIASRPDTPPESIRDATYYRLLFGRRRYWGIA